MKQLILTISAFFIVSICIAQIPQAFSFQSLVLDGDARPITEKEIGVQVQILDRESTGTILYTETHRPTTNANGLYSIEIGNGDVALGSFSSIDWLSGDKYVALSHDTDGGIDYRLVGSSQLLSVPYALASGTSFIAPKIYASTARINPVEIDVNSLDRPEIFSYRYEWIQGEPEDVYVEYSNLPNNINIQYRNGADYIVNASSVDTIIDGIVRPGSYFGVVDQSVNLIPGSYLIDATFRTENEVLEEIKIPLDIIDPTTEEVDCAEDYAGELIVVSICEELDNLIGTEVRIERIDNKNIIVRNFLDTNVNLELTFINDECVELRINNVPAISVGQYTIRDLDAMTNNGSLEFSMELVDQDGEDTSCRVVYGQ